MQYAGYIEMQEDSAAEARERERLALEHSIALLEEARSAGPLSRQGIDALRYLDRLWSLLLEDLANAENQLPGQLRASLISIGLWILREAEDIKAGRSCNFTGLIDVSKAIRGGLEGKA